jgi:hypothetical protein
MFSQFTRWQIGNNSFEGLDWFPIATLGIVNLVGHNQNLDLRRGRSHDLLVTFLEILLDEVHSIQNLPPNERLNLTELRAVKE